MNDSGEVNAGERFNSIESVIEGGAVDVQFVRGSAHVAPTIEDRPSGGKQFITRLRQDGCGSRMYVDGVERLGGIHHKPPYTKPVPGDRVQPGAGIYGRLASPWPEQLQRRGP